jgi:two-component system, sensor histidine kinase PdtaS
VVLLCPFGGKRNQDYSEWLCVPMPLRRYFRPTLIRSLPTPLRWTGAAGLVLVAFAIRHWLLADLLSLPFLLFFPAIILSAVVFNRGSGVVATLLSAALAVYFFVPPLRSFAIPDPETAISVGLFVLTGLLIALIIEALHGAYVELEQAHAETEQARKAAEEVARERDLLLVEFGHRVKNDLARIGATVGMQAAGASPETAAALRAVSERIRVLARVHDRLARREGQVLVDMHDFLHDLVADLRFNLTDLTPVGLFVGAERHSLPVSRAGAVGLIANELVTNALKHAFPGDLAGEVRIGFWREDQDMLLTVADDGVGPADIPTEDTPKEFRQRGGMGRQLVRALAAQLGGHVETTKASEAGGVLHILRFPAEPPGDAAGQRA